MTAAAEAYAARVDAVEAQRARVLARLRGAAAGGPSGGATPAEDRWVVSARLLRADPRREPEPDLALVASYVEPADVLVDVGGGTGRLGLALALRCREVVNVEPSPAMRGAFAAAAAEAGVANVRTVEDDWTEAREVEGDVVLAAHVVHLVRDVVPFVERLEAAARRRVAILLYAAPPEAHAAYQRAFRLLWGEAAEIGPGHRELLPVLWEVGILPDVRVLGEPPGSPRPAAPTRDEAVARALQQLGALGGASLEQDDRARRVLLAHFDELFRPVDDDGGGGFRPASDATDDYRRLLVTWEPRRREP